MNRLITEYEILGEAIDAANREVGLQLEVIEREVERDGRRIDAIVRVPEADTLLVAEVKKWMAQANLGAVINQINQIAEPGCGMLVADYINPNMGEELKRAGIQFIDTAGNAYINQKPIYIYTKGNKLGLAMTNKEVAKTGRAFQPTGMKVVFAFLKNNELINAPYRKIADEAQVALGTVGWAIRDLIAQGILLEGPDKKQRKLADFDQLLDKWVEAYPHRLKQKHKIGTFTTDNPDWWVAINPEKFAALWGGEIAAAKYTNYLNPKNAVVYINKVEAAKFLQAAQLRKPGTHEHPDIRIDLIEPFWDTNLVKAGEKGLAHPIITYADLLETGDPRNLDTANRLREKYID